MAEENITSEGTVDNLSTTETVESSNQQVEQPQVEQPGNQQVEQVDTKAEPQQKVENQQAENQQSGQQAEDDQGNAKVDSDQADSWGDIEKVISEQSGYQQEVVKSFVDFAKEKGINPEQAQGVHDWLQKELQNSREKLVEAGKHELVKDWGKDAELNRQKVLAAISRIDRQSPGFAKALDDSGATCYPAIVKGLYLLAKGQEEDSLGKAGGDAPEKAETALEGISQLFK